MQPGPDELAGRRDIGAAHAEHAGQLAVRSVAQESQVVGDNPAGKLGRRTAVRAAVELKQQAFPQVTCCYPARRGLLDKTKDTLHAPRLDGERRGGRFGCRVEETARVETAKQVDGDPPASSPEQRANLPEQCLGQGRWNGRLGGEVSGDAAGGRYTPRQDARETLPGRESSPAEGAGRLLDPLKGRVLLDGTLDGLPEFRRRQREHRGRGDEGWGWPHSKLRQRRQRGLPGHLESGYSRHLRASPPAPVSARSVPLRDGIMRPRHSTRRD